MWESKAKPGRDESSLLTGVIGEGGAALMCIRLSTGSTCGAWIGWCTHGLSTGCTCGACGLVHPWLGECTQERKA